MKALLMFADRDFGLDGGPPPWGAELTQDLELDTMFAAMARNDPYLDKVARQAVLRSIHEPEPIIYRQAILQDCINHPLMLRQLYQVAVDALESKRKSYLGIYRRSSPTSLVYQGRAVLELFTGQLRQLRLIADDFGTKVESPGLLKLFALLRAELDDEYLTRVAEHLTDLQMSLGIVTNVRLGRSNAGTDYALSRRQRASGLLRSLLSGRARAAMTFRIHERDDAGSRVLADMQDRALNRVGNALVQSADHIESFFSSLRAELAFYVACLNLHETLTEAQLPLCFPVPAAEHARLSFQGLYDLCLALTTGSAPVGNDLEANGKTQVIITGANKGGKSTFLRSVGLAQLMMQCGMFVPAHEYCSTVSTGILTHFKREEDKSMRHGRLAEELSRMSAIAGLVRAGGMVLLNESFAGTNEREGSEIAGQILRALVDSGVRVLMVTHLHQLAQGLHEQRMPGSIFVRAERLPSGERTFRMVEGAPLPTSYGDDLYRRIFESPEPAPQAGGATESE